MKKNSLFTRGDRRAPFQSKAGMRSGATQASKQKGQYSTIKENCSAT